MPRGVYTAMLLTALSTGLLGSGCVQTAQERARFLGEDGLHLFQCGEYAGARRNFEAALALQPTDEGLLYNIGRCCEHLGEPKKAEECYRSCIAQDSNHAEARHALAVLMQRDGRKLQASEAIQSWLADEPKRAAAYTAEGWRLRQEGDLQQAQLRLQQALELEPSNSHTLVELGVIYEKLERPDRALVLYERSLILRPEQPEVARRVQALKSRGVRPPRPD